VDAYERALPSEHYGRRRTDTAARAGY